jgi:hypothetical protein
MLPQVSGGGAPPHHQPRDPVLNSTTTSHASSSSRVGCYYRRCWREGISADRLPLISQYGSRFFDKELKNGKTTIIELPTKDPQEWEIIVSKFFEAGEASQQVTQAKKDNIMLLLWNEELCLKEFVLEECL